MTKTYLLRYWADVRGREDDAIVIPKMEWSPKKRRKFRCVGEM